MSKYKLNLPMYHPGISYDIVDGDLGEESNTDMHKSQLQRNQNTATRHATFNSSQYPIFSLHTNPPRSLPPSDTESRVGSIPCKYVNKTKAAALKNETSPLINDQHNFSSIADVKVLNLQDAVPDKHALKSKEEADVAEPAKSCGYDGAEPGGTRIAAASGRSKTLTCLEVDVVTTESFDKASKSYVNNCSKTSKY